MKTKGEKRRINDKVGEKEDIRVRKKEREKERLGERKRKKKKEWEKVEERKSWKEKMKMTASSSVFKHMFNYFVSLTINYFFDQLQIFDQGVFRYCCILHERKIIPFNWIC